MQYIELTIKNLSYRKLRTFLTLLGIIIGITAVVSMVSIGAGMTVAIRERMAAFGTNKIFIGPTYSTGIMSEVLTDDDAYAIEKIIGVDFVSPMYSVATGSEFRGEEKVVTVWGLSPEKAERTFSDVGGYRILEGRWLRSGDKRNIVIGFRVYDDYYERRVNVGNTIKIKGESFRVVGIFMETGNTNQDNKIFADIDQMRGLMGKEDSVSAITVRTKGGYDVEEVRERIEDLLERRHEGTRFAVMTAQQMIQTLESAFKVVQVVFGGIAAISLIVGGIGIANTMIMNVLERTREIGVMKATGASNLHVMKIFLFESGVIGVLGGTIGICFGYGISRAINVAADIYLGPNILSASVTTEMVLFALFFSFIVGTLSGVYPAYKAVKLNPVEALRA